MSDEGERTCPLCAEEMDLTDQQLKPCKCGYQICVWCWHHIMDMAEKDETEGRCPACRTPYNKEKIVGMAANCGRMVAEMNMDRKMKSQKTKSKTSDGRKQLSSVRVIQRNLVYVMGLPLSLADEDLLQHGEYFGQYGKVLKVSMSRTAAGSIQQFANDTCSVYITYSKEEEAVRCIQSVHGFVLDGRPLRACFGTTKYCHAWLRNVPCSNPDCLYLHEIGLQEDSFSKDEVVSAYTRSRVQQITGFSNTMQRHSGTVLPPSADECYINSSVSSGKPVSKAASNNTATDVRGSLPISCSGRPVALPSPPSWGMRASNSQPLFASLACPNEPSKQKAETCGGSMAFSTAVAGTTPVPILHGDFGKKLVPNEEGRVIMPKGKQGPLEPGKQFVGIDRSRTASEVPASSGIPATSSVSGLFRSPQSKEDKDRCNSIATDVVNSVDLSRRPYVPGPDENLNVSANRNTHNLYSDTASNLCSNMASMGIDKRIGGEHSGDTRPNGSLLDNTLVKSSRNQELQQCYPEQFTEPVTPIAPGKAVACIDDNCAIREQSDLRSDSVTRKHSVLRSDSQTRVAKTNPRLASPEVEDDLRYFDDQRLKDPEVNTRANYFSNSSHQLHISGHSVYSSQQHEPHGSTSFNLDPKFLDLSGLPVVPNGCQEDVISSSVDLKRTTEPSYSIPTEPKAKHVGRFGVEAANADQNLPVVMGESCIISNILSMDSDVWDESLTSPQNLAKLLGETDRLQGSHSLSSSLKAQNNSQTSHNLTSSWKVQNSGQSRFSFARQDESKNTVSYVEQSSSNMGQVLKDHPLNLGFAENREFSFDRLVNCNGFSTSQNESGNSLDSYSHFSPNKLSVSRAQVSAPPGFSVPSRAPPPGFACHERNHLPDASSLRNPSQAPSTGNIDSIGDIEFMDPAILAVGKGRVPDGLSNTSSLDMRSNFPSQFSAFDSEANLQLLMQRSLSPLQNQRFGDMGEGFSPVSDAYRIPSRIMEQPRAGNLSLFSQPTYQLSRPALMSNGQWNGWNEIQSGNEVMAELLRNDRQGFSNLYTGYEDSKIRMPGSGDLYSRTGTYGI